VLRLTRAGFGTSWAAAPAILTAVPPIIAAAVLGLMHSYPSLFARAGLASIAAGVTITRVRSVR
jgi:pyrroline-5-carboxylate reductase